MENFVLKYPIGVVQFAESGGVDVEKLRKFFREIRAEIRKIHWPNRDELLGATGVVLIILGVTGIYFFFLDMVFSNAMEALLRALGIG